MGHCGSIHGDIQEIQKEILQVRMIVPAET